MALDDFARRVQGLHDHAHERSQTARLKAYFPVIDRALKDGLSLDSILRELRAEGFTFQLTGLKSALYRLRKNAAPVRTSTTTPALDASTTSADVRPSSKAVDDSDSQSGRKQKEGWKTIEQLRAEHPTMPKIQLNKLYAQQYDRPKITSADLEELKRKYAPKPKP
jgi:hypothetical protein